MNDKTLPKKEEPVVHKGDERQNAHQKKGKLSFIKEMNDKTLPKKEETVVHKGDERQNATKKRGNCRS